MAGKKLPESSQTNLLDKSESQWFERRGKVVMLLVDALRFDYLLNGESTESNKRLPDHKLKRLNNKIAENPEKFVVIRARADAPTMTVNRIPCIATGNIPPKLALLQALEASKSVEDSFLRQLKVLNRTSYFTGDPLWVQYFPEEFTETQAALGFNIKDQNVDSNPIPFLKNKIIENNFDFLLGHLLAIDHMGHAHGLSSPKVQKQIALTDAAIIDIIKLVDDETTLIILGDHGMDKWGTHGGGTEDEMNTAIVAYHKKGFQKYHQEGISKVMRSINETTLSVKQQDITSTVSMLLGVPIPFSNLGQIINDIYPKIDENVNKNYQCNAGFEIQMMHDNYLNCLQILNYFEKFQLEAQLFDENDLGRIGLLAKEVEKAYQTAVGMIQMSQQCEESFHEVVTNLVLKTQNISEQVYQLTLHTGAFDVPLIHEGLALLFLVMISYILIMQYLYRKGHNEKNLRLDLNDLKKVIPILIPLGIAMGITWHYKREWLHCLTTLMLCLAIWFCGSLLTELYKLSQGKASKIPQSASIEISSVQDVCEKKDDIESIPKADQTTREDEQLVGPQNQPVLQSSLLFILQAPLFTAIAVAIMVYCVICVQLGDFDSKFYHKIQPISHFAVFLAAAYRVHSLFPHKFNPVIPLTVIACVVLFYKKDTTFTSSETIKTSLGLLLLLDFVCREIDCIVNKLRTSKFWGIPYLACFGLLVPFHMMTNRENYWVEIAIPRLIWALLLGIIATRYVLKIESQAMKRNMQLCLVLYLALLQRSSVMLYFSVLLAVMRAINHLFKNANVLNFIYPVTIAVVSQFGLHMLDHDDRTIPKRFDIGFIGFHDFHILISSLMVFLNIMTSYVLGMVLMSHYNQSLDMEEPGKDKNSLSKEHVRVVKKKNILPYLLTFSLIYLGAAVKCYLWRYYLLTGAQEKYAIDSVIYILAMFGGFCLF